MAAGLTVMVAGLCMTTTATPTANRIKAARTARAKLKTARSARTWMATRSFRTTTGPSPTGHNATRPTTTRIPTHVSFRWNDRARGDARRTETLEGGEFVARYLRHVLPRGLGLSNNR